MGRPTLEGVDLKLKRAKENFSTLADEISAFLTDPESYGVVAEEYTRRHWRFRVTDVRRPPPDWGILIGECVHQYRSALDHLAFQLLIANTRGRVPAKLVKRSEFPIFNSGPRFRGRLNRKGEPSAGSGRAKIQGLSPEAAAIIEALQPYHRRKNPGSRVLWQLQELANVDKHRLLHVTYSAFEGSDFAFETGNVAQLLWGGFNAGPLKRNAVVAEWKVTPIDPRYGTKVDVKGEFLTDITFGKSSAARAVRGASVVKTLHDIGAFIASDVVPPLAALMGLASEFEPGKIIDVAALSPDERDSAAPKGIQIL